MIQCPCGIARDDCTYHKPEEVTFTPGVSKYTGGRGSGRTTRQLQALPKGGWFFYHGSKSYIQGILARINRTDIVVKDMNTLKDYWTYHGWVIPGFDVDHFVTESGLSTKYPEIADGMNRFRSCVKPWANP